MQSDEQYILKLLKFGWADSTIASYLNIERETVSAYRRKYGITPLDEYYGLKRSLKPAYLEL
ncbi:MAG: hypothetical protein SVR08_09035 [Spirochaetota bacterium]|nr:hypothetical protein [Spirochaetota bacterium]